MSKPPEYGSKVKFTRKYKRAIKMGIRSGEQVPIKYWKEISFESSGIFLGVRYLQNGQIAYDRDYAYYFMRDETFKAALVSPGPSLNPVYVPIDDIEED